MAQEPSSKDLLEAVKQQESGGRRYKADGKTLLEGPQTKYGTAKGEMQVLDMTNKDPGYGVKPARDDSPDERARVGRDYLNAMVNKYGNRETALVAYNWGPGNTDKWLDKGGDFSKLPKETQNYVTKITGALGSTKLAQAPAAPKTKTKPKSGLQQAVYKAAPLTHPMLSQLGPNYQAAMAVSMLADENEKEGKSEYEPSESEKMLTEATARPVALSQVDLGYQSPFPELNTGIAGVQKQPQPIKMAAGGVPYAPTASVRPSARAQLNDVKSQWDAFNNKATDYNTKADEYNQQVADYQKLVDAYNAGPRTEDFTGKEPTFTYTAPTEPTVSADQYQGMADAAKKDVARRSMALSVASNPEQYGLSMNKFFADGGVVHRADGSPEYGEIPTGGVTDDTRAAINQNISAMDALRAVKDAGMGVVRGSASNLESLLRGAVSQVPGVVGDLESGGRQLLNFSFGPGGVNVGEKTVAPTSSEIRARVPRITATRQESSGMESMGELVAPGLAKTVAPVAKAAAKGTAKEMLRGIEGQGVLAPISPQGSIMYAVKPRGGTFLTSGSLDLPAASKLDKALESYADRAIQNAPDAETTKIIRDFIDKKARKYFTTEFATGADPIRTAISSGEISPIGKDVERFPEYLLYSARNLEAPGHQAAKRDLERAYDQASGVKGSIIGTHDPADADARRLFNERVRLAKEESSATMAREGTPVELQNPDLTTETLSDLSSYTYNERLKNAVLQNPEQFPAVMGAVERTQPIYDFGYTEPLLNLFSAKTVAENIAALPPNKLKNMSFADAMIEGSKRMEVSRNYDKAVDLVAKGAAVPKEVVMQYTKPVTETGNGQWVQLTDKMATKMEGKMLHHSVGGYADSSTYGHGGTKGFDAGDARVFSLRDPKTGLAKVTVEGRRLDDGRTEITQIKGDFNSFPEQYKEDLFKFFDHMGYKATFPETMESYRNTPTGGPLETPIYVNWGKEYERWSQNKPEVPPKKNDSGQSPLPGFYKGGMVERQTSAAQYI
jgi:hypothetical protein